MHYDILMHYYIIDLHKHVWALLQKLTYINILLLKYTINLYKRVNALLQN